MAIAEISALISSLKATIEITKSIQTIAKSVEVNKKVIDLQNEILKLQAGLLDIQAEYSRLLEENNDLRKKIEERSEWEDLKNNYKLKEIARGVFVYEFVGQGKLHWLCASCFDSGKKSILQLAREMTSGDYYKCNVCNKEICDHSKKRPIKILKSL